MRVADVDEIEEGEAGRVALANARAKARAVATPADGLVLGCDTVVTLDGRNFGKAADVGEARAMLETLSGRVHEVVSGVCLLTAGGPERTCLATTTVTFREIPGDMLEWYLEGEEWRERAGAYAIQGRGAAFVERIDGDYLNVVGLPVAALLDLAPELLPPPA